MGRADSLGNDLIAFQKLSRLDISVRMEWEIHQRDGANPPNLKQLTDFLRAQILAMESVEGRCKSSIKAVVHSKAQL